MKPNIDLRIEELVLHGFPPGERYRIAAALQSELQTLLAERGLPPAISNGGVIDRVDAGSVTIDPKASSRSIGRQVARSVYGGVRQ